MPATRHIRTVPNLGHAIVAARDPETGDEVWLVDPTATADEIVNECSEILEEMNNRCGETRATGAGRRSAVLAVGTLLGLALREHVRMRRLLR